MNVLVLVFLEMNMLILKNRFCMCERYCKTHTHTKCNYVVKNCLTICCIDVYVLTDVRTVYPKKRQTINCDIELYKRSSLFKFSNVKIFYIYSIYDLYI